MKRRGIILSILIVIIAISWGLFSIYWIYLPGIIFNLRYPISKNKIIEWYSPKLEKTNPLTRDPNIIIILADDLGYNGN